MKKALCLLPALLLAAAMSAKPMVTKMQTNHMNDPQGLGCAKPVFSWIISDDSRRNVSQSAYRLVVRQGGTTVWDSGKVASDASTGVKYAGAELLSDTEYTWKVMLWDDKDKITGWSSQSSFSTGLFHKDDWKAAWIEPNEVTADAAQFRRVFRLGKSVERVTLHASALGMYEAFVNGKRVGEDRLTPGWTSYQKRVRYQTYDITDLISQGDNAIGINLARGWWGSILPYTREFIYGEKPALITQICVTYKDGSRETIGTDASWKYGYGEINYPHLYDGETIDRTKETKGWSTVAFNDSAWSEPAVTDRTLDILVPTDSPNVRVTKTLKPVKIFTDPEGNKVVDFGQNLSGHEKIRFRGKKGDTVKVYHAETLDKDGVFYTENLRTAKALSTYVLSGEEEWLKPHFAFYGFRYIKLVGIEEELNPEDFVAEAITSNIDYGSTFECSDPRVNQLYSNVLWSMKDNFVDVPTDCPQRDERLGWTGDALAFFNTATHLADVQKFFSKWLADLRAEQYPDGAIPKVAPYCYATRTRISAGWSDAIVLVPWRHFLAYGDLSILEENYKAMKGWVDYMFSISPNYLWRTPQSYGDWVYFDYETDFYGRSAVTIRPLVQQFYLVHTTETLAAIAGLLGEKEDEAKYRDLYSKALEAFRNEYVTPGGCVMSDTQTAYTMSLAFNLLEPDMRQQAADRLVDNVKIYGHMTTGFIGTPLLCNILTEWGYSDVAYDLLLRDEFPAWLYSVKMGATTIWEKMNSIMPDGSITEDGMNSLNHYSYGAIADWLFSYAAGIRSTSPGYKTLCIKPYPDRRMGYLKASRMTPFGKASSSWEYKEDGSFTLDVEIPANTTAKIMIPAAEGAEILESGQSINPESYDNGYAIIRTGSGKYSFKVATK